MAALARRTSLREQLLGGLFAEPDNPFLRSGPAAELALFPSRLPGLGADPAERGLAFSVREARRRLAELISGALRIGSWGEMLDFLRERRLTPEIQRRGGAEKGTVHLRDEATNASVVADSVHPRVSTRAMSRLAGKDVAEDGPKGPSPAEVRYRDALKIAYRGRAPGYGGWEGLKTGLPNALSRSVHLAYTVSGGVAYIGRPGTDPRRPLECLGAPERTREMLYAFLAEAQRRRGAKPPSPERFARLPVERQTQILARHFVFDERMTPRTPVLMRDAALVRAERVHPDLAAERLRARFGQDFAEFWSAFHRDQVAARQRDREDEKVVDFRAAAASRRQAPAALPGDAPGREPGSEPEAAPMPALGEGFGGIVPTPAPERTLRSGIVIVVDETSPEPRICRHSPDGEHRELPQFRSLHELPEGEYRRLVMGDTWDAPSGYVVVDEARGVTFLDARRREHSLDGPSHLPAPGNHADPLRWAIEGRRMDRASWEAELAPRPAPQPAPRGAEEPGQAGLGFGYGAPTEE